ncbi:carboxylesterase family protein [Staphylococcus caledonicus]|uniref:carboxylesterase family protein n=1 Tax=Staphylococcus caledonicus TaxID=2741333 RepID=UPI0018E43634|nr:carboxylesterase family protein [Staphylococcus caledonicus]MBI5973187.1 carboxylesterase/lipase family protein [Staphylococcus caledonicus]
MVTIQTHGGSIRGIEKDGLHMFLGIPYAYPPTEYRRFKHSELVTTWDNIIDASAFQNIPPQPDNKLETFFSSIPASFKQSEDCLYLNIWSQNNQLKDKPVIIYFYGGGFVNGHGSAELYTLEHIVQQHDVVVVTFNYRLGALGYLDWSYFNQSYHKNNGLSDQINVLKWANRFIEDFGGDPHNITLMGQSAGSMSIMALMQQPELDMYYQKVILLSGTLQLDTLQNGYLKAQHFDNLREHHFPNKEIEELSANEILKLMEEDERVRGKSKGLELIYAPIDDTTMCRPLSAFTKPVVVGYTQDEGDCYIRNESRKLAPQRFVDVMKLNNIRINIEEAQTGQQQAQVVTDLYFKQPALQFLDNLKDNPHKWLARFDWSIPSQPDFNSAYHILDLVFWFGKMEILNAHDVKDLTSEKVLSQQMMNDLVYFAKNSIMPWAPYTLHHTQPHKYI